MEHDNDDNKIFDDLHSPKYDFKYNFINTPWDYRSMKSKIGIMTLLLGIFSATMGCVVLNLMMHYSETYSREEFNQEVKCHLVNTDEYPYTARIHSAETRELLCVGALVSSTTVLANTVCVKSGPVRLYLGSISNPRCKKGFTPDIVEPIVNKKTLSKRLVLITTYDDMEYCGRSVSIGQTLHIKKSVYIIGRPLSSGRSLSEQPAKIIEIDKKAKKHESFENTLCVTGFGKCPVRAGDLLLQNDHVFGLASASTHFLERSKVACFDDLRVLLQNYSKEVEV